MSLITVQQAWDHLRLPGSAPSPPPQDLVDKMAMAEAIILDYLKVSLTSPPDWDVSAGTVPKVVQIATLVQLAELWRFRGDDPQSASESQVYEEGQLSPQVTNYLRRWRDPALA